MNLKQDDNQELDFEFISINKLDIRLKQLKPIITRKVSRKTHSSVNIQLNVVSDFCRKYISYNYIYTRKT